MVRCQGAQTARRGIANDELSPSYASVSRTGACFPLRTDYDQTIRHPVLEYHFITPKEDNGDGFDTEMDECDQRIWTSYYSQKCDELKDRLDELTLLELANSPAEKRPAEYDLLASDLEIASSLRGKFEIPDTQSYYDDDVIAFLAEAWEDQAKYDELEEAEQAKRKSQEIAKVRIDPF